MLKLRLAIITSIVSASLIATAAGAVAAPKDGCPAAESGWTKVTVDEAAATVWAGLLDKSPWTGGLDEFTGAVAAVDRGADANVCLKTVWGDRLNPNAHWYKVGMSVLGSPAQLFIVLDNNSAATG